MSTATLDKSDTRAASFVRGRLGSLLAVAPLGVWTVIHLWNNLAVFKGGEAWEQAVTHHVHPLAQFITALVVMVPLLIHAVWGMTRIKSAQPNPNYTYFANLKYVLQRLSAIGLLLLLGAHLWKAMLEPRLLKGHAEAFTDISQMMHHHMPTLAVYVLGTLGVSYHLANGLATFAMGFGIVSSRRGLRRVETLSYVLFAVFLLMSWSAIYGLYVAGA